MVEATCVPWPLRSTTSSYGMKLRDEATTPARSGCSVSYPVSRTATSTPLPVLPRAQASGAPICATLDSSVALTLPSSQTLRTPPFSAGSPAVVPRAAGVAWVSSAQKSAARLWLWVTAVLSMLVNVRAPVAPSGRDVRSCLRSESEE